MAGILHKIEETLHVGGNKKEEQKPEQHRVEHKPECHGEQHKGEFHGGEYHGEQRKGELHGGEHKEGLVDKMKHKLPGASPGAACHDGEKKTGHDGEKKKKKEKKKHEDGHESSSSSDSD
ncbi:src1 protein [Tripterygium wilfordii]|uniref:Src1 protein n=1 Tax=Tripterygium wilfordii TaxID=458696 RepID=A0A7J7DRX1_TRIWF|nr:protein SRC1 [Tripterygium wilfordii]KAF5749152.1 src1 protein [Tripterygium wilfordii]